MKGMLRFAAFGMGLGLLLWNCASYIENRRKDFQDILQIGVETPVYGGGVRVGPVPLGFFFAGGETELGKRDLGTGYGMRGGEIGKYRSQQLVFGFLGGELFHSGEAVSEEGQVVVDSHGIPVVEGERANLKSYKLRYLSFFNDPVEERQKRKKEEFRRRHIESLIRKTGNEEIRAYLPEKDPKPFGYPSHYPYQVEVFLGLYGGIRVGLNLAEAVDFVLGLTTGIDILKDDLAD